MSKPPEKDNEAGYGRPPKATQFQKGHSGNPSGRPKGARNLRPRNWAERLADVIRSESERQVTLRENGEAVTLSMLEAVFRILSIKAVKGDVKAINLLLTTTQNAAAEEERKSVALNEALLNYKDFWSKERAELEERGEPTPDIPINPDNIVIDEETGNLTVIGRLNGKWHQETGLQARRPPE